MEDISARLMEASISSNTFPHSVLEYTPNQKISDIASMLGVLFHEPTDTKLFVVEGVD